MRLIYHQEDRKEIIHEIYINFLFSDEKPQYIFFSMLAYLVKMGFNPKLFPDIAEWTTLELYYCHELREPLGIRWRSPKDDPPGKYDGHTVGVLLTFLF